MASPAVDALVASRSTGFLRRLARRGLRGVKLVVSDAHEGIKAVVSRIFTAAAFAQDDTEQVETQWRRGADRHSPKVPKLAALRDRAEPDVLADRSFPSQQRAKRHSTNSPERLNGEIKRRADVVGILPNEAAITRLVSLPITAD